MYYVYAEVFLCDGESAFWDREVEAEDDNLFTTLRNMLL